jgi:hypothetical protein
MRRKRNVANVLKQKQRSKEINSQPWLQQPKINELSKGGARVWHLKEAKR